MEGTVTKNGRPLANVRVVFLPDADADTVGPRSIGWTDEAGHYRLRTDNGDDGAVTGKYRVAVRDTKVRKPSMGNTASGPQPKETAQLPLETVKHLQNLRQTTDAPRIPPYYGSFNDTQLRAEVHSGAQILDFDIP